jgi:hypothetical protein
MASTKEPSSQAVDRWMAWYWGKQCDEFDPACCVCQAWSLRYRTGKRAQFHEVNDAIDRASDATDKDARTVYTYFFRRALAIKRTLGPRYAAGYLRNKNVSIEAAVYLLARKAR